MKKTINYISIAAAIIVAGSLFSCSTNQEKQATEENQKAIKVSIATAEASGANSTIDGSGQIHALESANISTRMMGRVEKVKAKSGMKVKKGDLLIAISSADLKAKAAQVDANIAQANAAFQNASNDYKRFQNLHQSGSASDKELENMKSRYEMAKGSLEAAESMKNEVMAQFEYLNIRAPFDGTIANTFVKAGDMASPGFPLISLESMAKMEAVIMISEEDIKKIEIGQKAIVDITSIDLSVNAKVKEVSYSSKNTGGQYIVKLEITGQNKVLLPGMFVNAKVEIDALTKNNSVVIPESAIVRKGQLSGVYTTSDEGKAILRWLRLGELKDEKVEVLSGLSLGENYILSAEGRLYNGIKISY